MVEEEVGLLLCLVEESFPPLLHATSAVTAKHTVKKRITNFFIKILLCEQIKSNYKSCIILSFSESSLSALPSEELPFNG